MKMAILALGAVAAVLGTSALAQTTNDQAQVDYQIKQEQYQQQREQYKANQDRYQDQKRAYHHQLARWAAGQPWPERYWGDHYIVSDWAAVHLHDPGAGYRWYRDDNGNYVRVATGTHVIEEVYVR